MKNSIGKDIVVLYHADCPDGFGGAWAARKKFGARASYVPVRHQMPPPAGLVGKTVYLIDFTYPEKIMAGLIRKNMRVTSIDHHVSAERATKMTEDYSYAVYHSGAVLAWRYFHPGKRVPRLLRHVEDQDLWNYKIPGTRYVGAVLDSKRSFTFPAWEKFVRALEHPASRRRFLAQGKIMAEYEDALVRQLADSCAVPVRFLSYRVLAVNSPLFGSRLGNVLSNRKPPFAIVWWRAGDRIRVSLRSDGSVDVSKLATRFGGGGHRAAAGFSLSAGTPLPWRDITNSENGKAK